MKLFFISGILLLTSSKSFSQSIIRADEITGALGKDKEIFIHLLLTKGFQPSEGIKEIAQEFADDITRKIGRKYNGVGYASVKNYSAIIIYNTKGIAVGLQFGTKRPNDDEIKSLVKAVLAMGYKKTLDRESNDGEENLRAYDKGNRLVASLS